MQKRKLLILSAAAVLAAAIAGGIWYWVSHSSREPVLVIPFDQVGMSGFWGDQMESYGPITTDKIQTVFLSESQTVTEILVKPGDPVKKGDLLMTFDTTLSDLALEKQRLAVEKLKLDLSDEQDRLREIRNMKPMVIPEQTDTPTDLGVALGRPYRIYTNTEYSGESKHAPMICWMGESTTLDNALMEALRVAAEEQINKNAGAVAPVLTAAENGGFRVILLSNMSESEDETGTPEGQPDPPSEPDTPEPETTEPTPSEPETTDPAPSEPETTDPAPSEPETTDPTPSEPETTEPTPSEPETTDPAPSEPEYVNANNFYVVIKVTQGDMSLGTTTVWQGVQLMQSGGTFQMRFFDASGIPDFSAARSEVQMPEVDLGSGYTAGEIYKMRLEQEAKIKQTELEIKLEEAQYKIMQAEINDGNIYSDVDGYVVSALTEEEAKRTGQPVLKVSGGGGFYIEGSVSELELQKMEIGMEVTVNDWRSGMVYPGTIQSIGNFPSSNVSNNGMQNPMATYYPFRVFVDETADLQEGQYANIQYSLGGNANGLYLENPYIRTENGQSYVLLQGADGKLERRDVTTGKSVWGSYTQILQGITQDDLIAFPYGKHVKPGAATVAGDAADLYR